ncbi:MAG: diaminopimelate epimerase [Endomicrobium sp.]|jgi:diaminopimelate epimerase|nr:diaminopimelate epimerase [Endomicrobium sp.]
MNIKFIKITAAGNDFILIDNRSKMISSTEYNSIAKKLCNRKYCIGADGLILLEKSNVAEFKMKYFNSDGSYAAMCGNGARAIAYFAYTERISCNKCITFETDAGLIQAEILLNNQVKISIYDPCDIKTNIELTIEDKLLSVDYINTGVPHVIIFIEKIQDINVKKYGKLIRYHDKFKPIGGTNVNFVEIINTNSIFVRTYERGVEDETLACGTGITASGIMTVMRGFTKSPVNVTSQGGDRLIVSCNFLKEKPTNVILEGPALITFKGTTTILN